VNDALASALLKLDRADKHITDVKGYVEAFNGGRDYVAFTEYDADTDTTPIKLRFDALPDRFTACAAADAIQNMRSALDHLAWQVHLRYRAAGNPPLGMKKVSFGIYEGRDEYIKPASQELIDRIGGLDWAVFLDNVKPYRGGNKLLFSLNLANNLDKHRDILDIGTIPTGILVYHSPAAPAANVALNGFRRWPIQNEITIATYPGKVEVKPNVQTSFDIVLGDIEGIDNESVAETLNKLLGATRSVVSVAAATFF
jgi:hypothetical protein